MQAAAPITTGPEAGPASAASTTTTPITASPAAAVPVTATVPTLGSLDETPLVSRDVPTWDGGSIPEEENKYQNNGDSEDGILRQNGKLRRVVGESPIS